MAAAVSLNTVNCAVMVDPTRVPGEHTMFMCGDDPEAKARAREILTGWLGWSDVIDLGDISGARATEALMLVCLAERDADRGGPDYAVRDLLARGQLVEVLPEFAAEARR